MSLIFVLTLSSSLYGQQLSQTSSMVESEKKYSGAWFLKVGGLYFDEDRDEGTLAGVIGGLEFNYKVAPFLDIQTQGDIRAVGGRIQSRFDEDQGKTPILLREGYLRLKSPKTFEFLAGFLNQKQLKSPLLVSRRAFPGLSQRLTLGHKKIQFRLIGQQTIPTSYSLSTKRSEKEETPTFLTETVEVQWSALPQLKWGVFASHYSFNNLPSVVAFESGRMGNSFQGEVAANSQFQYEFDGYLTGTELCFCSNPDLSLSLGGHILENSKAPEGANRGQMVHISADLGIGSVVLTPFYGLYFNESDTSPAYYNDPRFGHSNREGQMASLTAHFKDWGFKLVTRYFQSEPINTNPYQRLLNSYEVIVETAHVEF